MGSQRFRAVIDAGPRHSAVIVMPFNPDEAWGAKPDHPVGGRWVPPLASKRLISMGIAIGDEAAVELAPEGPQRGVRAARIAEVTGLLAAGVRERPRS
jgi:hypothetical protein